MKSIPVNEIDFDPTSYVDPNGRVFSWKGEIYRAIHKENEAFYKGFMEDGFFKGLMEKGLLVETEIAPLTLDGFGMILKHKKVPTLTYCMEWPATMLKEAALLTLDLAIELTDKNLTLQDAYPWNVYFDGTKPVFIDLGSIVEADKKFIWIAYDQFCRFFLYPLYMYAAGREKIARTLLFHYWEGITSDDILQTMPLSKKLTNTGLITRIALPSAIDKIVKKFSPEWKHKVGSKESNLEKFNTPKARKRFLTNLRGEVASIKTNITESTWINYYKVRIEGKGETEHDRTEKQKIIGDILDMLKPESALDLGCNTGRYSELAAEKGIRVVATDKDEQCVSHLHLEARKKELDIIPLIMDTINPTPKFGWCSKQFPSAIERLQSEMVFALALIHHLVFKQWQSFPRIIETLKVFSTKYVIVEFVPIDDPFIAGCWEDRFSWYTIENLTAELEKNFSTVESFDSHPEGRKLLLCTK
jgi:hypothetical protein